jgi:hypothetical protein
MQRNIEVNILITADLHGQKIKVNFHHFIRADCEIDSPEELKIQLGEDRLGPGFAFEASMHNHLRSGLFILLPLSALHPCPWFQTPVLVPGYFCLRKAERAGISIFEGFVYLNVHIPSTLNPPMRKKPPQFISSSPLL